MRALAEIIALNTNLPGYAVQPDWDDAFAALAVGRALTGLVASGLSEPVSPRLVSELASVPGVLGASQAFNASPAAEAAFLSTLAWAVPQAINAAPRA